MDLEKAAKENGFDDEGHLLSLVAAATLDTPEKLAAFERWKLEDGTLDGLAKTGLVPGLGRKVSE